MVRAQRTPVVAPGARGRRVPASGHRRWRTVARMELDPKHYDGIVISDSDVRNIVLLYLVHNCFKETAGTFLVSMEWTSMLITWWAWTRENEYLICCQREILLRP